MNKRLTCLFCALLLTAGTAFADANRPLNPPRVYTGVNQPHGKPTPSSGFAPRPGRSGRHVYGAPIQKPILKRQPPKPKPPNPTLRTLSG
jgi:hypothetical protein